MFATVNCGVLHCFVDRDAPETVLACCASEEIWKVVRRFREGRRHQQQTQESLLLITTRAVAVVKTDRL